MFDILIRKSFQRQAKASCKDHTAPGVLLPDQEHFVLVAVIDLQFSHRV